LNKKVALHSNCILVKGAERSVICDLQLQAIHYIPNSLYELLNSHLGKSLVEIKKVYNNEYDDIIDDYFNFLEEKECVFYTNTPELFPKMDLEWDYPHEVSNAIIDYNKTSNYDIVEVLNQLNNLNCKSIQLRFFSDFHKDKITTFLNYLQDSKSIITSVELIIKENNWTIDESIKSLFNTCPRLTGCTIHTSTKNEIIPYGNKFIIYTQQAINSEAHCGIISMKYFTINLKTFTESKKFNSCLNRKISIDTNGNIKNCPSMHKSFGSVKEISLQEVLNNNEFKTVWDVTKDKVSVCKDCEFRYVCTDCRAYTEDPEDTYSKPLKCGYNPYTNEWEDWSKNKLKNNAIQFYGLTELIKK